ncbi:MAG: FMN-binding protein [Ruminococcus sp.]|nr:FMN-binding protein [Ruminococcus sp.]
MTKKEMFMPTIVLAIICIVISGALVFVNYITKDAIAETNAKTLNDTLVSTFGDGEYNVSSRTFEGITSIIDGEDGLCVYEITTDGYSSDGIHVLIGIRDGEVEGISFVSCGETPGLGTKVNDAEYLSSYEGVSSDTEVDETAAVTGATFSSTGLKAAVKLALEADKEG